MQTEFSLSLTLTPNVDPARNVSGRRLARSCRHSHFCSCGRTLQKRGATLRQLEHRVTQLLGMTGFQVDETECLRVVVVAFRDSTVQADLKTGYANFKAGLKQTRQGVRVLHEVVENLLKDAQTVSAHLLRDKVQNLDVAMKQRQALSDDQHEGIDVFMSETLSKCACSIGHVQSRGDDRDACCFDEAAFVRDFGLTWNLIGSATVRSLG